MKTITSIAGFIVVGHAALFADGLTIVTAGRDAARKVDKLIGRRAFLSPLDRKVTPQEFADITGFEVTVGKSIYKPS